MKPVWPPYEVLMPLAPWEEPAILASALESLAQQRPLPQCLVLCVDGPLPSALRAVLKAHWHLPLALFCGPGVEGVGLVLARGLAACCCELILRADADDLSLPHRAALQLAWMVEHPEVIACSGWIVEFVDLPEHKRGLRRVPSGRDVPRWALWRNPLNHPAVMLRRSPVLSVGSYRDQPNFEDYDLWLRLLHRYGHAALDNLPQVIVQARVGRAHLARRRGIAYARAEAHFLWRNAQEGQMHFIQAILLMALRLPWRLLPAPVLAGVMRLMRR